jgi:ribonuclease T2
MKAIILLLAIASVFSFNLRQTKQNYDSYVMAVQWPNGYCKAKSCGGKDSGVPRNAMTIHGLWPSLKSGQMLKDCTSGVKVVDDGSSLFSDMKTYWPSFAKSNKDFWEHEYNKHGHCMTEEKGWGSYKDYFRYVIDLHVRTYKSLITNAFRGKTGEFVVNYDDMKKNIRNVISGAIINMKCVSGYITEFYFYLEKNMTPSPNSKFSNSCKSGKLIIK